MGLFLDLVEEVLFSIAQLSIKEYIKDTCANNFDQSYLEALNEWLEDYLIAWLKKVSCSSGKQMLLCPDKLKRSLYESYVNLRWVKFLFFFI